MKKFTFLVAALCATMMASAAVIQIDNFNSVDTTSAQADQTVTVQGVTLAFNGTIMESTFNEKTYTTLRVFAGKTLTVSCESTITKIEVIGMARKGAKITADKGTVVGGDYSSATADAYKYENGFTEPLFVVNDVNAKSVVITPVKQIRVYGIRVTTGSGSTTPDDPVTPPAGDEVELTVNSAQAVYYAEYSEEGAQNWEIDLINITSDEYDYTAWMFIDLYTPTATKIAGKWSVADGTIGTDGYSGLELVNGTDTTLVDATDVELELTYTGTDETYGYLIYDIKAKMVCTDGKTYTVADELIVVAFDAETDEDIVLEDDGATAIRNIEIDESVYANEGRIYAEDGARIYTINGLDVTRMNGQLNGVYIVKNGNKVAKVAVAK